MKKVFSNSSQVIHLFAQRSQSEAKCSNVFFYNDKIYSYGYHYLLAEFVTNKQGANAIIINDKGYSNTTSSHISEIIQATRQYKQFFTTNIDLKNVCYSIESNVEKLQNARKKELYINPSNALFEKLNEYIDWAGKKELRKDATYKKIVSLLEVINGANYAEYLEKQKKRIASDERKKQRLVQQKLKKDILDFKTYQTNRIYNTSEDYLRLSQCKEFVETSQQIKVPIKEAKLLYNCIEAKKDIKGMKIMEYTVISINGTLKIGCHNINIEDVHEIGKTL